MVHQLVGGITHVTPAENGHLLGWWLQIDAPEASSSHDHWSSEFLAALCNSLSPKRKRMMVLRAGDSCSLDSVANSVGVVTLDLTSRGCLQRSRPSAGQRSCEALYR